MGVYGVTFCVLSSAKRKFDDVHCQNVTVGSPNTKDGKPNITKTRCLVDWNPYRGPIARENGLPEDLRPQWLANAAVTSFTGPESDTYKLLTHHLVSRCGKMTVTEREQSDRYSAHQVFGMDSFRLPRPIRLPSACQPEVYVVSEGGYPCFTAEAKTLDKVVLTELFTYGAIAMTRSYFPKARHHTLTLYKKAPTCFGLVSSGLYASVLVMEMIGRLFATTYSRPFFLGSSHHREIVSTLFPNEHDNVTRTITFGDFDGLEVCPEHEPIYWTTKAFKGEFIKVVRYDRLLGDIVFPQLVRAYKHYEECELWRRCAFLREAHLWFSEWSVAVTMPFCVGVMAHGGVSNQQLNQIAEALIVLLLAGMQYVDLKPENVLIDGDDNAVLIDYDDVKLIDAVPQTADDAVGMLLEMEDMNERLRQLHVELADYEAAIRTVCHVLVSALACMYANACVRLGV